MTQREPDAASASLLGPPVACMVNENSPELLSGDREEMGPALPIHGFRGAHPQIKLVHKRSRFQRVIPAFPPHVTTSHTPEFFICCFYNPITSLLISGTPLKQEGRERRWAAIHPIKCTPLFSATAVHGFSTANAYANARLAERAWDMITVMSRGGFVR